VYYVNHAGPSVLTKPKWITQHKIYGYVPDIHFPFSGLGSDVEAYDLNISLDCDMYDEGPIVPVAQYRVWRDPMRRLNGWYNLSFVGIDKVYVGEKTYPPYMTPLYQDFPNPDDQCYPYSDPYPAFVKTTENMADELLNYAAYRRGWVQCLGTNCGYGPGDNFHFNPQGDWAVGELFVGTSYQGPNGWILENPDDPWPGQPTPTSIYGCGLHKFCGGAPSWDHSGAGLWGDDCGEWPYFSGACPMDTNPYFNNSVSFTHLYPFNWPPGFSFDIAELNTINSGGSVYRDIWIVHDVLGYSPVTSHYTNCAEYDQLRVRLESICLDPQQNISCG